MNEAMQQELPIKACHFFGGHDQKIISLLYSLSSLDWDRP